MHSSPRGLRRRNVSTRFLALGFLATLLLAVLTVGLALLELNRVERSALELADEAQRSTYYIADVAEKLARYRASIALGTREPPDEFAQRAARLAEIERELAQGIAAIPGTLSTPLLDEWNALLPQLERIRRAYEQAAEAVRTGNPGTAALLLEVEAETISRLHDDLDDLSQRHRDVVLARLDATHDEAARLVVLQAVVLGLFAAGLTVIFMMMFSVLRKQRRQLADYTARLETANAELDAFAGRVAHDLRSVLGPLLMGPTLLREAPADATLILNIADRTERSVRRAVTIIDALLAFSRAAVEVGDEQARLDTCLTQVLEELAPQIELHQATIEVAPVPPIELRCSAPLLHVVLANVCGNAIKYLEGRSERRVRIAALVEGATCRIEVEDTGPGIPAADLDRIFEPFYRVPNTAASGAGIGLATVRRIVDARGGRVSVQSELGHGAKFEIWLPVVAPSELPAVA